MKEVQSLLGQIGSYEFRSATGSIGFTKEIRDAAEAAKDLQLKLMQATNVNTGKLDLSKFREQLNQSGVSLESYAKKLTAIGGEGRQAFLAVANSIASAEAPTKRLSDGMNELWVTMKNTMRWQITSSAMHGFMGALQSSYGYAKDLNTSLTNIRIVSEQSAEQMAEFAKYANQAAKELSSTTVEYTDAALIYYQQGLVGDAVTERTDATIKMANVTGDAVEDVSNQLTAIWNNFYDGTKSLEYYADVITALGAATASSTAEISEGLEKFASIAETIGLSYEYATASLATVVAQTRQAPETVGTAFKTIFARVQGLQLGETLEDGTNLNKYSTALAKVGIDIFDQANQLKDMDEIIYEMGSKWETLNKAQQMALAQTVAGVRQYTQLVALLDNFEFFEQNLATAIDSEGELNRQADIYAESWRAAEKRVKTSMQGIYDSILEDDFFITLLDGFAKMLNGAEAFADALGGMQGVLSLTGVLMTKAFGDNMAQSIRNTIYNINSLRGKTQEQNDALKQSAADALATYGRGAFQDEAQVKAKSLALQIELNDEMQKMSAEQKQQINNYLAMNEAIGKLAVAQRTRAASAERDANTSSQNILNTLGISGITRNTSISFNDANQESFNRISNALTGVGMNSLPDQVNIDYLIQAYRELASQRGSIESIRSSFQELANAENDAADEARDYSQRLNILKSNIKDLGLDHIFSDLDNNNNIQEILNVLSADISLDDGGLNNIRDIIIDVARAQASLIMDDNDLENYLNALDEQLIQLSGNMEEYGASTRNAMEQERQFEQGGQVIREQMRQTQASVYDGVWAFTELSNALMTVSMSFSAFDSAIESFEAGNIKTGISSLLLGITSLIPLVGLYKEMMKGVNSVVIGYTMAQNKATYTTLQTKVALWLTKGAHDAVTTSVLSEAAAMEVAAKAAAKLNKVLAVVGIITAVVGGLAIIYNAVTVSQKEASEAINEATEAYQAEKEKLDELNNTLQTTKDRIEELNNQDTLTIIEQEELDKLKQEEAYLKAQIKLQEDLTKSKQATQAEEILENAKHQDDYLLDKPKNTIKVSTNKNDYFLDEFNGKRIEAGDISAAKTRLDELVAGGHITQEQSEERLRKFIADSEEYKKELNEWKSENAVNIQETEKNYQALIEAHLSGARELTETELEEQQKIIKELRTSLYSNAEYQDTFVQPLIDSFDRDTNKAIEKILLAGDNISAAIEELDEETKKSFLQMGVGEQEVLEEYNKQLDNAFSHFKNVKELGGEQGAINWYQGLSDSQKDLILKINWESDSFTDFESLKEFLVEQGFYEVTVKITAEEDIDNFNNSLSKLSKGESLEVIEQSALDNSINNAAISVDTLIQGYEDARKIGDLTEEQITHYEQLLTLKESIANFDNLNSTQQLALLRSLRDEEEALLIVEQQRNLEAAKENVDVQAARLTQLRDALADLDKYRDENGKLDIFTSARERELEIQIKAQTKELETSLDKIKDEYEELKIRVKADFDSDIQDSFDIAGQIDQLQDLISDDLVVTYEEAQKIIADGHGEIFKNVQKTGENALKIDSQIASIYIENRKKELEQTKNVQKGKLELQKNYLEAQLNILETELEARESLNLSTLDATEVETLAKITAYSKQADALQLSLAAEKQAFNTANTEMGEEAQSLYDIFADTYITMAEQASISSIEGADSISQMANSAIFDANQVALAWNEAWKSIQSGTGATSIYTSISGTVNTKKLEPLELNEVVEFNELLPDNEQVKALQDELNALLKPDENGNYSEEATKAVQQANEARIRDLKDTITNMRAQIGELDAGIEVLEDAWASVDEVLDGAVKGSKKTLAALKEVTERYHEITREIEYQERLLDELETKIDRAYGADKLKLYAEYQKELNHQIGLYNDKMDAAKFFLASDLADIKELGLTPEIDEETGEIGNYTELLRKATDDYNKLKDSENEEEKKAAEELYKDRIDALENYEDSLDNFREEQEKKNDLLRQSEDKKLEELGEKLSQVLNIKEAKDEVREFARAIIESFGDEITHGYESLQNQFKGALANMDLTDDFASQQEGLINLINKANEYTNMEDLSDSLDDLRGEIIATGEALLDWLDTLENALPEAIDTARTRFEVFTGELSHNKSILEATKEILVLQDALLKNQKSFNTIDKISRETFDATLGEARLEKLRYDESREALMLAWQVLQGYDEGDAGYDGAYNNWVALLEENQQAEQAYLDKTRETMEQAQTIYTNAIDAIIYEFEQALTDNKGLELLQQQYDNFIDTEERYLDEVNELYEITKYQDKLQKDIDETTNKAYRAKLEALQQEINARAENNTLSEYDLKIMEAKYNALQKQIALEEAQNNKSEVRLRRDAQGNWSYQFTNDDSAIAQAEQELADSQNEYYNIAKQEVKDVTGEIIATWQEMNDKLKEIYQDESLTVAEREAQIAEIREFYKQKILDLEADKNVALQDMTAAGGEVIEDFSNVYGETLDNMADVSDNFSETFDNYIQKMEDSLKEYQDTTQEVGEITGTTYEDLQEKIEDTSDSTDYFTETGLNATEMMWNQLDAIHEQINGYLDYAAAVMETVRALQQLASQNVSVKEDMAQPTINYDKNVDYMGLAMKVATTRNTEAAMSFLETRAVKVKKEEGIDYNPEDDRDLIEAIKEMPEQGKGELVSLLSGQYTSDAVIALLRKYGVAMNTGGYTGLFDGMKAAFLHEKELVLNQQDTENILSAVSAVRTLEPTLFKTIERLLDTNANNSLYNMGNQLSTVRDFTTADHALEQILNITAEFPNATDQNEIREAILGLANYATQFVNKR